MANEVSHVLQHNSPRALIDCEDPASDCDDHFVPAQPRAHVPLRDHNEQKLPIHLLTIEAYGRARNATSTYPGKCSAPNSPFVVKYKFHECDVPLVNKGRKVTNAAHALKRLFSLMGRLNPTVETCHKDPGIEGDHWNEGPLGSNTTVGHRNCRKNE